MNERVTVELDAEMLKRAQEAGLDLSRTLARALRRELPPLSDKERKARSRQVAMPENKEEIDYYNDYVAEARSVF